MATSKPLTLQVSDIIQWYKKKELVINEDFQRYSVWTPAAKTYLIDTILNQLPLSKIYLRTKIDSKSQTSIREIVDGQQRVRAMIDFAQGKLKLTSRSSQFEGKKYSELTSDEQEIFLGYTLTAEQLLNASDDDVIDIFSRLNSYTVTLNAAEKRHAEFQTDFKFAIRKTSQDLRWFIEKHKVFTTKQRFRMADDEFFAEVFRVLIDGVCDGGAPQLHKFYKSQDDETFTIQKKKDLRKKIDWIHAYFDEHLNEALSGVFSTHYHLLMMFAAVAHHKYGIPKGQIDSELKRSSLAEDQEIIGKIAVLEQALQVEDPPKKYKGFVVASKSSTQRIASRKLRFAEMVAIFGA